MSDTPVDQGRRTWVAITAGAGAIGGVAAAVPFVSTFAPSERAKAAGAAVEADISSLKPGEKLTVEWRGKPVWILRRTKEQLETLKKTDAQVADPNSLRKPDELTPTYARNEYRSIKPEFLVAVGICSHLGCSPSDKLAPVRCPTTGKAASSAPATAPRSTWRAESSRTSPHPTTSRFRRTCICRTRCC